MAGRDLRNGREAAAMAQDSDYAFWRDRNSGPRALARAPRRNLVVQIKPA
jgi:hypothetical protein